MTGVERGKQTEIITHWEIEAGGGNDGGDDGWMDERSWHGVREHLVGEFWVILLTMEPPSQTKTLVHIESKSADKGPDVDICSDWCFEEMGDDFESR